MLKTITSSSYHDQMLRFAAPLEDHFGINHFWYYKVTFSGDYAYLGTHAAWSEFCFDNAMISHFPCLRHPNAIQSGIQLMKTNATQDYQQVIDTAWEKFKINFNINLINKIPEGMEAFGFATRFNDPYADQRLLNHLPLLRHFTRLFRTKHVKILQLLENNQVNLFKEFGPVFYERSQELSIPCENEQFLRKLGYASILSLTVREKEVLKYLSNGYPASYIALQLKLSTRTVENYLATIKSKLACLTKVELIRKAHEVAALGYFES